MPVLADRMKPSRAKGIILSSQLKVVHRPARYVGNKSRELTDSLLVSAVPRLPATTFEESANNFLR